MSSKVIWSIVGVALGLLVLVDMVRAEPSNKLDFLCCSRHADREAGYNEKNYGLFYENSDGFMAGVYKNSEFNTSVAVGGHFNIFDTKYVDMNMKYGLVTGYEFMSVAPFILPEFEFFDVVTLHWFPSIEIHRYNPDDNPTVIKEDKDIRMNWAISFRLIEW